MNHNQQSPQPINSCDLTPSLDRQIILERLRQAQLSFNLALVFVAIAAAIILTGAILLLSGKLSEGSLTAISGIFSATCCARFAKECNDRLDRQQSQIDQSNDPD
jgi:hypothetical protein